MSRIFVTVMLTGVAASILSVITLAVMMWLLFWRLDEVQPATVTQPVNIERAVEAGGLEIQH